MNIIVWFLAVLPMLITFLLLFTLFAKTGQWQWDFKYKNVNGGGTMGSWDNELQAVVWRLCRPQAFDEDKDYFLVNKKGIERDCDG